MTRTPDLSMGWWDRDAEAKSREPTARLWASTYAERDEILRSIGFETYALYLASDLWRGISSQVLKGKKRCYLCRRRRKASQCHHQRYTRGNLLGNTLAGIYPLCDTCHVAVEFQGRQKRPLKAAQKEFGRLRRWKKWPKIVARSEKTKKRRRRRAIKQADLDSEFQRLAERDE